MITFKHIRFKNILSFGNTWTEINLNNVPISLIRGKNGSGKSGAILDTICFALFGKPFRKINKPQLVNYRNKDEMVVEITMETSKGEYLVRRGSNPQLFEIIHDGVLENQNSTIRDYQGWFESNVLQFDYNTFTQIVLLGKATFVSFMKLNLDQRRKFVENILGLNIFSVMGEIHKTNVNNLKESITAVKNSVVILKERKEIHEMYIKTLKRDSKLKKKEEENRIAEVVSNLKKDIKEIETKLEEETKKKITIDYSIKENLKQLERKYTGFVSKAEVKAVQLKKTLDFFNQNESCPTCHQDISTETKQSHIDESQQKLETIKNVLKELKEKEIKVLEDLKEFNRCVEENHQLGKVIEHYLTQKNEKNKQINDLTKYHSESNKEEMSSKQIEVQEKQLLDICDEYDEELNKKSELLDQLEYYELVTTMLKDTGIKKMMIARFMPFINTLINVNLNKLGFFIKLTFDENFSETLLSRGIDELSYYNYSEGEKFRIDLAILMAWREVAKIQNNMNTNLLIFDEIFDSSLDEEGVELFTNFLMELSNTNIFIVTHSPEKINTTNIKETLFFEKHNGFSRMVKQFLTAD